MMKRLLALLLCVALCLLCACSSGDDSAENAEQPRTEEAASSAEQEPAGDAPVSQPETAALVSPSDYNFTSLSLPENGFSMEYPSHWSRIPGSKSVCFVEPVNGNHTAARVTVTSKLLDVTEITEAKKKSELTSFLQFVIGTASTYELGELNTTDSFLGDEIAYSITYTATLDNVQYRGYAVLGAVGKHLVAYHFRAGVNDYSGLNAVMGRLKNSVRFSPDSK